MIQDFTVQKKAIFVWKKKKNSRRGITWKKIRAQAVSEKKKQISASWKFPNPPPPPPSPSLF